MYDTIHRGGDPLDQHVIDAGPPADPTNFNEDERFDVWLVRLR